MEPYLANWDKNLNFNLLSSLAAFSRQIETQLTEPLGESLGINDGTSK